MSWYSEIDGEIVTSAKALRLVMDLIGQWTHFESEGTVQIPQIGETITIALADHYRNLGQSLPEAVLKIARRFPDSTRGEFTIMSTDGCHVAESYRVSQGKMFRRTFREAPEREVFLHQYRGRNGPPREVVVSEQDLARMKDLHQNGNHSKRERR